MWQCHRFSRNLCDVQDLLAERGVTVSHEAIRNWCAKFGPADDCALLLGQAVEGQGGSLSQLLTDRLRSYAAALHEVGPTTTRRTRQDNKNTADVSLQHKRKRERQIRRFKSEAYLQRFLSVHRSMQDLFRVARRSPKAIHYCLLREQAVTAWEAMT